MRNQKVSPEQAAFLRRLRFEKYFVLAAQALLLALFFALWEFAADKKWIDPFIFSQPTRILKAFAALAKSGAIFTHIGTTVAETLTGFLTGSALGVLIAVLLWWNGTLTKILNPYLVVLNSLPKTALAPIIIVWVGNNVKSVIVTALLTSVIVTVLGVLTGFLIVDKDKLKLVYTFSATKTQALTKVILPASMPSIMNALKINIGLSFVGVIVGEFLVAKSGLGYLIVYGSQIFICVYILIILFTRRMKYNFVVKIQSKFNSIRKYK